MKAFGLVGKNISYSFSKPFFETKFKALHLEHSYTNFDTANLPDFIKSIPTINNLQGFNVTIPYKEQILPFLDSIDSTAEQIGAVNTVKVVNKKLIGYNTDYYGFNEALTKHLKPHHHSALILGTGGASKAVTFGLKQLGIKTTLVSRNPDKNQLSYNTLEQAVFKTHKIIVNTTPLGTFPNIDNAPSIPYQCFSKEHIAYDLIYNPAETRFLKQAKQYESVTINGELMLIKQAEKAWDIWNG